MEFNATEYPYRTILNNENANMPYPLLRDDTGQKVMTCISPLHGRSFLVAIHDEEYVVSKGNGLSYTNSCFINTEEFGDNCWGLLLKEEAERDFILGEEIRALGVKTNIMEYVLEIQSGLRLPNERLLKPYLLQYTVKCPYRICDFPFMDKQSVKNEIEQWNKMIDTNHKSYYMMAAEVLIKNLAILHKNGILHNAIHSQNYTWALELLDFELACSPKNPYTSVEDRRYAMELYPREIMQTYEIINYIAWCLSEKIDYKYIDGIFRNYGFEFKTIMTNYNH